MRSVACVVSIRSDWFHGMDLLVNIATTPPRADNSQTGWTWSIRRTSIAKMHTVNGESGGWPPLSVSSGERDVVVLEREGADALAGRREIRVEHGGRGHEDGRLADTAPEVVRRHDDRFDL